MCLIAFESWITSPLNWILMGFSIGLIIFVHELGHFLVAKACGVRCDKFYLGFDFFGLKIVHFQWGETEYGIGVFPLGGYVKMLGQDDNPGNAAEEAERTKKKNTSETDAVDEGADEVDPSASSTTDADCELDPRSYTAKSVPQRMAIISAGVIMNVIFAFVFATIAYGLGYFDKEWGVKYVPCEVSALAPGGEAWKKNTQPGDLIVAYGDLENPSATEMRQNTVLTDTEDGVPVVSVRTDREGHESKVTQRLYPQKLFEFPTIGVKFSISTMIVDVLKDWPAGQAPQKFKKGDKIIAVNGEKVRHYGHLHESLARDPTKPVHITIERKDDQSDETEKLTILVGPKPMRRLGLVMEMGKIVAVQENSPAADAGIQAGDFIEKIKFDVELDQQLDDMNSVEAGEPPGDPMTLPERLRREGAKYDPQNRVIFISVKRKGETLNLRAELRPTTGFQSPYLAGHPVSETSLGIAYRVVNRVADVIEGHDLPLQKGDVLVSFKFVPASDETHDEEKKRGSLLARDFMQSEEDRSDADKVGWPIFFFQRLQLALPDTKVELTFERKVGDETEQRTVTLSSYDSPKWYIPERGFGLKTKQLPREVSSLGEAMTFGFQKTIDSLTLVFRTLNKLFTGGLSPKHLGGMGTIFAIAGIQADRGIADLLIFMTIISANLAIINFLPIPVLDGGHMVLLVAEAIRRKPVSERILIPITYAGLIFILGLFLFVTVLDVDRGWQWLREVLS